MIFASKTRPEATQNRPGTLPRRFSRAYFRLLQFVCDFVSFWGRFGSILAPFWLPRRHHNRAKIAPKLVLPQDGFQDPSKRVPRRLPDPPREAPRRPPEPPRRSPGGPKRPPDAPKTPPGPPQVASREARQETKRMYANLRIRATSEQSIDR